jgi:membrane-bound metal-dependent hydrolase YbcI (DUF457 family)
VDIATHAGIGLIAASPFLSNRPELALGIVAGSVLPDLDAFSRLGNKRAFLQFHQTWSHAVPVQAAVSVGVGAVTAWLGGNGIELGGGLFAGLLVHSLLDLCNTFGVALFAPFSRRRFCLEWVFFIDAVVLAATAVTLALSGPVWFREGAVPVHYAAWFFVFLMTYFLGKGALRNRAQKFLYSSKSLVPSALVPWRFYGTRSDRETVEVLQTNAVTGAQRVLARSRTFDGDYSSTLEALPEFRSMQELSPAYHVIQAEALGSETRLLCRDMRMRNFGTRFGDLEVWLDTNQKVLRTRFHV